MTRDEFIDGYLQRSKLNDAVRTEDGFTGPGYKRVALPCDCGEDYCEGWAMISDDRLEAGGFSPGRLRSLWDMLQLNAAAFYRATSTLRDMAVAIKELDDGDDPGAKLDTVRGESRKSFCETLSDLYQELEVLGTRVTQMVVRRLIDDLESSPSPVTYKEAAEGFSEIESRLRDELSLSTVFVIPADKVRYFRTNAPLFGAEVDSKFPSAAFEISESGKCLALERNTAAVFHLMRALEVAIEATRKCIGIPNPVKEGDRNWGAMLRKIKEELDRRNKQKPQQWSGLEDQLLFSDLHASLDAVRNVWRNATMHVEKKYTSEEAEEICWAVRGFMRKLSERCDEHGLPHA